MPHPTPFPVEFDLAGTRDAFGSLERAVRHVEDLLGNMTGVDRIAGVINWPPGEQDDGHNLCSNCHPPGFDELRNLPASEVLKRIAPYLHAVLLALESQSRLPSRISEIPDLFGPGA